jgi:hypothetical protein
MAALEGYLVFFAVVLFLISALLNILFYRISVMYIERELIKEDKNFEPLEVDKGIGARGVMYNQIILFKIKNHPYVDSEAVVRIARKKDWWLAFLSFYSLCLSMIPAILWSYLYAA